MRQDIIYAARALSRQPGLTAAIVLTIAVGIGGATSIFSVADAVVALALAALGIYALMSYSVASRTREIGIRLALGAQRADVRRRVMGDCLRLSTIGLALGLAAALTGGRLLESLLYGVTARDPLTLSVVPLVLMIMAALACLLPALRATRIDPAIALRED